MLKCGCSQTSKQAAGSRGSVLASTRRGLCVGVAAAGSLGRRKSLKAQMGPLPHPLPKLVAFDLDSTLWYPEMYMLSGGFKKDSSGAVRDSKKGIQPVAANSFQSSLNAVTMQEGEEVELIGASKTILRDLATNPVWADTEVAYVSRTEFPDWATQCMKLFDLAPGKTMHSICSHNEIYETSKKYHFRNIQKRSGIDYGDMIFFDNERWNCSDVASLGVTCVYTPDGMSTSNWLQGLEKHAQKVAK